MECKKLMQEPSVIAPNQDVTKLTHYVRVTGVRNERFVEFDYSLGDPTIYIELVLPFDQFKKFCRRNNAKELTVEQITKVDLDRMKWRYGEPGKDSLRQK